MYIERERESYIPPSFDPPLESLDPLSTNPPIKQVLYVDTDVYFMSHTYIHVCMHAYIHKYIHKTYIRHTYIHTYIHRYTYIHTCIHTHVRTYIPMYVHTYIHTYIHSTQISSCAEGNLQHIPAAHVISAGHYSFCCSFCPSNQTWLTKNP